MNTGRLHEPLESLNLDFEKVVIWLRELFEPFDLPDGYPEKLLALLMLMEAGDGDVRSLVVEEAAKLMYAYTPDFEQAARRYRRRQARLLRALLKPAPL